MENLSRKQFDLLVMASESAVKSQREAAARLDCSVGTVNKVISELTERGYLSNGKITNAGLDALEPYRAKRAVFIAAGFGSRMVPITLNTPKPLVRVFGVLHQEDPVALLDRLLVVVTKIFFYGLYLLLQEELTVAFIDLLGRTTTDIRLDIQFL